MAIRKELGDRIVVSAGKTYTLKDSVKDMAGLESEGMERLMADCMEEAISELKEGEEICELDNAKTSRRYVKPFYTVKELAHMLGCGEENVRKLARKGHLPARKLGRRIIFLKEELEDTLRSLPLVNPHSCA